MDAVTYQIDPDQPDAWCSQCQLPCAVLVNVRWQNEHGDLWTSVVVCRDCPDHMAIAET